MNENLKKKEQVREPVLWFAGEMEKKLQIHVPMPHWSSFSSEYLLARLKQEVGELAASLESPNIGTSIIPQVPDVISECADVANFAMMIADNFSGRPSKNDQHDSIAGHMQLSVEPIRPFDEETPYKKLTRYIELLMEAKRMDHEVHKELNEAFAELKKLVIAEGK